MGGKALGFESLRVDFDTYSRIWTRLGVAWVLLYGDDMPHIEPVEALRAKDSFGDMDCLVCCTPEQWLELCATRGRDLGATMASENGNVLSLGVPVDDSVFQIDLINCESREALNAAARYFAWGDAGNLIGRIAALIGFKYGHDGLSYVLRAPDDPSLVLTRIPLYTTHAEQLAFMGLDPMRFAEGFDTEADVFEYVCSSPLFAPQSFLLENRNAKSRVRDVKRPMYMRFLDYCKSADHDKALDPEICRRDALQIALRNAGFQAQFSQALTDYAARGLARKRFNGNVVAERTGLKGRELGDAIAKITAVVGGQDVLHSTVAAFSTAAEFEQWLDGVLKTIDKELE